MRKKHILYLAALLCLAFTACAGKNSTSSLQQLAGNWAINFEESFTESTIYNELLANYPDEARDFKNFFSGMVMAFAIEEGVSTAFLTDGDTQSFSFIVVSGSTPGSPLVLEIGGATMRFDISGDRLQIYEANENLAEAEPPLVLYRQTDK